MPTQAVSGRVRLGILALPVSSALVLAGSLIVPFQPESEDVRAWAEYFGSSRLAPTDVMFVLGAWLGIFAFVALYAYLANGRAERWAFYAMVLTVPSLAASSEILSQDTILAPIANQYLEGQEAAWEATWPILNDLGAFGLADGFVLLSKLVLFPIGLVLFAVAIWRSQTLPQGAAILWLAYLLLFFASPLTPWALSIAELLFTVASGWIAWVVLRQPDTRGGGGEAKPRVQ